MKTHIKKQLSLESAAVWLLIVTLPFNSGLPTILFYLAFFLIVVASIRVLLSGYNILVPTPVFLYGVFVFYALMSALWAIDYGQSIQMVFRIFAVLSILVALSLIVQKVDIVLPAALGILTFCYLNLLLAFAPLSYVSFDPTGRFFGLSHNSNIVATYLVLSIPIVFLTRHQWTRILAGYWFFHFSIIPLLIILTGSRKGLVFGFLALISSIAIERRRGSKKRFMFGILFLLSILSIPTLHLSGVGFSWLGNAGVRLDEALKLFEEGEADSSTRWRQYFILEALQMFRDQPLFGIGADNYEVLVGHKVHSNYFSLLSNLGAVGFLVYYSIYLTLFVVAVRFFGAFGGVLLLVYFLMEAAAVVYYERHYLILLFLLFYFIPRKYRLMAHRDNISSHTTSISRTQ